MPAGARGCDDSKHMLHGGATQRLNRGLRTKLLGTLLPTKPGVHDGCRGSNFRRIFWARQLGTLGVQPRWFVKKPRRLVVECLRSCKIRPMADF
jgi:hypothetical protein